MSVLTGGIGSDKPEVSPAESAHILHLIMHAIDMLPFPLSSPQTVTTAKQAYILHGYKLADGKGRKEKKQKR